MRGWYWTPAKSRALEVELARTHDAGLFRRLLALWQLEHGCSMDEVAWGLRVGPSSVYRWMQQFAATGKPEVLEDRRGRVHIPDWDQDCDGLLEAAFARTPAQLGYPANQWTVPILQAFLSVFHPECAPSASTIRRRLRALGYVWKRFRYVLAPDPEREKKTSAPAPDPSLARLHGALGGG